MESSQPRWHVVQSQPHAEAKAVMHLGRQGFETYLPRYLKRRRHARRIENVAVPLFPGYFFVAIDRTAQRWRSIQSTVGVARLVCNGDEPAALADNVITTLKMQEGANGLVQLDLRPRFTPGERVRIVDGAFTACLGLYESMTDRDRVTVLLDLLGRKVKVVVDELSVAAA